MFVFGEPERPAFSRPARLLGWLAILAVLAGAVWFVTGGESVRYSCAYVEGDIGAEELCHRQASDKAQRAAISAPGPIGHEGTAAIMRRALSPLAGCLTCRQPQPRRPATEADVAAARQALAGAGLPNSVVRVARADDPAPDGALVYSLLMGDGCVVGYLEMGTGDSWHQVAGLLPNGRCLAS